MNIQTAIAANRFGLGARPGELARIDGRHKAWLKQQLAGPDREPVAFASLSRSDSILADFQALRAARREGQQNPGEAAAADFVKQYTDKVRQHYRQQTIARYVHAIQSDLPFHERLVHFWNNHFAVSADKQPLTALTGAFENEAIRPNLDGKFSDLLLAVTQHPAMLTYLDNQQSIGPGSALAQRANRRRNDRNIGLNENLAREILELHTLGVDGGYTQSDVTSLAKVITGWSVGGNERGPFRGGIPGQFYFRENIHEPGKQTVLGNVYKQPGVKQGKAVLKDLATHPATARHLATKLARHFIADNPTAGTIDRLATVFVDSGGDLAALHTAIIDAAEGWQSATTKYKSPHDYVISAFRALDHVPDRPQQIVAALVLMGQTPYRPGSPSGWPDTADEWGGADALYKRIEWANSVARFAKRVNPSDLAANALGPALSTSTSQAIARAESSQQGVTLLLASPDFLRR